MTGRSSRRVLGVASRAAVVRVDICGRQTYSIRRQLGRRRISIALGTDAYGRSSVAAAEAAEFVFSTSRRRPAVGPRPRHRRLSDG